MPAEYPADPTPLHAVAAVLALSSTAALEASDELLAHYSDTGDAPAQRAVDTLLEHAADALRALTDCLGDAAGELRSTASAAADAGGAATTGTSSDRAITGYALAEVSGVRPRPESGGSR